MAFNIALSGLNAAQTDLDVKGNNISNASTTGFKRSRTEFGDLYSSGLMNLGSTDTGEGVKVQNTRQLFQQGNVTATSNGLDMAINGEGFFVVNDGSGEKFTRAGEFGVNQEGFITNNQGARVQGFQANEEGEVGDVRGDLTVNTENLAPKRTTGVDANVNLDAREEVLAERFRQFEADDGGEANSFSSGFSNMDFDIELPNSSTVSLTDVSGSAREVANQVGQQDGLRVDAATRVGIQKSNIDLNDGNELIINGENYTWNDSEGEFENLIGQAPQGVSVSEKTSSDGTDYLEIVDDEGNNLDIGVAPGSGTLGELDVDSLDPYADEGADYTTQQNASVTLDDTNTSEEALGSVEFRVDEGYSIAQTGGPDLIPDESTWENVARNTFNPDDPQTYNHSTSTTIYDSLGNSHEMTQFFVKESSTGPTPENRWTSYVQIDGENVGPDDADGDPTLAGYDLRFNDDGSLNENLSDETLIDNWTPKDASGNPNGAAGPNPGGETPIPQPPESSNFAIDYGNTTQVGAEFAINDLQQDGFSTGRLTGLEVTDDGVIQARFSNGESDAIGQVALANFRNNEGLAPVGDTAWVETFESGDAVISRPNSGPLGSIQSSSVEESNVDLSEQLVGLITAQRNFQANSKTIETSDQITQTIINLR